MGQPLPCARKTRLQMPCIIFSISWHNHNHGKKRLNCNLTSMLCGDTSFLISSNSPMDLPDVGRWDTAEKKRHYSISIKWYMPSPAMIIIVEVNPSLYLQCSPWMLAMVSSQSPVRMSRRRVNRFIRIQRMPPYLFLQFFMPNRRWHSRRTGVVEAAQNIR